MWPSPFLEREPEAQVFVDPTGRRAVAVRRAMHGGALLVAAWLGALVLGTTGSGGLPAAATLPSRVFALDRGKAHLLPRGFPVVRVITPRRDVDVELPTRSDRS